MFVSSKKKNNLFFFAQLSFFPGYASHPVAFSGSWDSNVKSPNGVRFPVLLLGSFGFWGCVYFSGVQL